MKQIIILLAFLTTFVKAQTTTYTLNTMNDFSDFTIGGTPNNGTTVIQSSNFAPLSFTLGNNCNKTFVSPTYTAPIILDSVVVTFSTVATVSISLEMLPAFPFPTYFPTNTTAKIVYYNTNSVSIQTLNINSTHPNITPGNVSIFNLQVIGYKTTTCPTPITYSIQITTPPTCSTCCDGSAQIVNLNGGCGAYLFLWIPGALTSDSINSLCAGSNTVTVSDGSGCCPPVSQSFFVPTGGATSINKNYLENHLSVSPNPINSILNIVDENNRFQNANIEIKNYLGQVVYITPFTNQINLSDLSAGMYFLTVQDKENRKTFKIVKE